jgi:hypothetical protein
LIQDDDTKFVLSGHNYRRRSGDREKKEPHDPGFGQKKTNMVPRGKVRVYGAGRLGMGTRGSMVGLTVVSHISILLFWKPAFTHIL